MEQIEQSVLGLSAGERRQFLDWFYAHEAELIDPDDALHPEVKAEILQRWEEALAHPEKLEPWENAFPRMKQRFNELRESSRVAETFLDIGKTVGYGQNRGI